MGSYQKRIVCVCLISLLFYAGLLLAPSAASDPADLPYTVYLPYYARRPATPVPDHMACIQIVTCRRYGEGEVCAVPSTRAPKWGSPVTVYGFLSRNGVGVPGQVMDAVASDGRWAVSCNPVTVTDDKGWAECVLDTSWFEIGRTVEVEVNIAEYQVTPSFVVQ